MEKLKISLFPWIDAYSQKFNDVLTWCNNINIVMLIIKPTWFAKDCFTNPVMNYLPKFVCTIKKSWPWCNQCPFKGVYQYLWLNLSIQPKTMSTMLWPMSCKRCVYVSVVELAGGGFATSRATSSSLWYELVNERKNKFLNQGVYLVALVSLATAHLDFSNFPELLFFLWTCGKAKKSLIIVYSGFELIMNVYIILWSFCRPHDVN